MVLDAAYLDTTDNWNDFLLSGTRKDKKILT